MAISLWEQKCRNLLYHHPPRFQWFMMMGLQLGLLSQAATEQYGLIYTILWWSLQLTTTLLLLRCGFIMTQATPGIQVLSHVKYGQVIIYAHGTCLKARIAQHSIIHLWSFWLRIFFMLIATSGRFWISHSQLGDGLRLFATQLLLPAYLTLLFQMTSLFGSHGQLINLALIHWIYPSYPGVLWKHCSRLADCMLSLVSSDFYPSSKTVHFQVAES